MSPQAQAGFSDQVASPGEFGSPAFIFYAAILCGPVALWTADATGWATLAIFLLVSIGAWLLQRTSLRLGTRGELAGLIISLVMLAAVWFVAGSDPAIHGVERWRRAVFGGFLTGLGEGGQAALPPSSYARSVLAILAHATMLFGAVKLLGRKRFRDQAILFANAFAQLLLAASLSISLDFSLVLAAYVFLTIAAAVGLNLESSRSSISIGETRLLLPPDSKLILRLARAGRARFRRTRSSLPAMVMIALLTGVLAAPLFLFLPRYSSNAYARSDRSLAGFTGFSDSVTLGAIGRLQQSDRVVMRVRVEGSGNDARHGLRWRGIALDEFTGTAWRRSRPGAVITQTATERGMYQFGRADDPQDLMTQTFFVEPIDSNVLFAASRAVAVQAGLNSLRRDSEGSLFTDPHEGERIIYKVFSDTNGPAPELLRADNDPDFVESRYLQLPANTDPRIRELAVSIIRSSAARNRYDAARAIEAYLQSEQNFRYSLDLRPTGADPLAGFLFSVREGHCEYFASSMAVMLRSVGIPARVVNGFQTGEYNPAARAYTVTERDAHSWVEVLFPATDSWVAFDPTPAAGRQVRDASGIRASVNQFAEAVELLWIQYVAGYDRHGQRALATSIGNAVYGWFDAASERIARAERTAGRWFHRDSGDAKNAPRPARAVLLIGAAVAIVFVSAWLLIRIRRLGLARALGMRRTEPPAAQAVQFYTRFLAALAGRGYERPAHQTPLEFAAAIDVPEATAITRAYNRVRFGRAELSRIEAMEIEDLIARIGETP